MNKPLFEVGEEVILQSKAYPEYNGEAVVISYKVSTGGIDRDGVKHVDGGFSYRLTIDSPVPNRMWHELAIKKKHKPSEMSFDGLMSFLKSPVKTA